MTRIEQLQKALPEGACAYISDDINRRYFTGMKSSAGVLYVSKEKAELVIDFRYIEKARETVTDCGVTLQTHMSADKQTADILSGMKAETVMTDDRTMTVSELNALRKKLTPHMSIDSTSALGDIIRNMRRIKSQREIELMTKAQRIAEEAFEEALNFIKEGVTEREIALCLNEHMMRKGAEDLSFETIALCGASTSMPHGVPTDKPLKSGEFVLMDFGAVWEGYHSDMTRTVALGEPAEEMERVYDIVLTAQEKALSAAKAGITGKALDSVARDYIRGQGYEDAFGHGLGHSVGLEIHESPCANTRDDTELVENMIMTVEPGIYLAGKFGVRIEDFVVIKQNSCYNLTNAPKNLIKL